MATHSITRHHGAGKATSKKIHEEFHDLDNFFKAAGLEKDLSKTKDISFKAVLIQTRGFKFDRKEANAR